MAATPKSDQLRAMRERNYETMKAKPAPAEKLAKAREALAGVSPNEASPNGYARNAKWRDNNRAAYNAGQKALMARKRRNELKANATS